MSDETKLRLLISFLIILAIIGIVSLSHVYKNTPNSSSSSLNAAEQILRRYKN